MEERIGSNDMVGGSNPSGDAKCSFISSPPCRIINLMDGIEQTALNDGTQEIAQIETAINAEVAVGISPWLAHVHHNKQGVSNPLIVGVYQEENGKIRPIYGQRKFKSLRQVQSLPFEGRAEVKEVNLLDTQFQPAQDAEILKGEYWSLLPDDLRTHFDNGEILVTGGNDMYALSDSEIKQVAVGERKYMLLYYSDYKSDKTGRAGVVMVSENGSIEPLIIRINDQQFAVEVKGCGTKSGGFGEMHHRTGRDTITGGAEREQAINEFNRLQDDEREGAPKAVGSVLFNNSGYEQGYIIRLTPSTVRASYSDNEVYPQIESPEIVERILLMYSQQLAEHIYSPTPKILDRSSHTENLLVWGDGEFTFTDYSDHVAFSDGHYPYQADLGGYMTPKQMLKYYIEMVKEIPGYVADRDRVLFYDSLNKAFHAKKASVTVDVSDEPEQVVEKIWKRAMAYEVFKARKKGRYIAEGALRESHDFISRSSYLSMESQSVFGEKLRAAQVDIKDAINLIKSKGLSREQTIKLDAWLNLLNQGNLYDAVTKIGIGNDDYNLYTHVQNLTDDEKIVVYRAISYFSNFGGALVFPFEKYFRHELDVVQSAMINAPQDQLGVLEEAEQEIRQKLQQFKNLINGDTDILFQTLQGSQQGREIISFNFYGH